METDKRIRITIYPDKKLKDKIKALAEKEDRTMNNFLIRELKKLFK